MLDYRPDLDPRTPGMLTTVSNVVPTARGYQSAYTATAHTAHTYSLQANEVYPNKLFASRWLSTPGGIVIAATNQRLNVYEYTNGYINVSKAGDYSLASQTYQYGEDAVAAFDLCAFGDVIIACNKGVATQYRSALDLTSGTLFADLTGAPQANTCCVARNFVFLGNCGSWSTVVGASNILAWSALADHTDWDVDPQVTQASYAQFSDTPGPITCVRAFRDGVVVFKADAMYYGRYVGAGTNSDIWDFERVSDKIGCVGHRSVADIDTALIFVGKDDVYSFDGTRPQSITQGIYQTIKGHLTSSGNFACRVGHDKPNTSIWLASTSEVFVWNYRFNRWGRFGTTNTGVFCNTNADDFRKKTLSSVSAGAQTYTTTTDHYNLYTLMIVNGAPKNFNTTRSTSASLTTGYRGDPVKMQTLRRVNPILATAPASVAAVTCYIITSRFPNGGTSSAGVVAMNSSYRMDTLATAGMSNNFFSIQLNLNNSCEVMDIGLDLVPSGER